MIKAILILFVSTFLTIGCQNQATKSNELIKVPHKELLNRIMAGEVVLVKLPYKDDQGKDLSIEQKKLLNQGKMLREFYENNSGEIVQIRIKKPTQEELFKEIQVREFLSSPFSSVKLIDIDCSKSDSLINDSFYKDQSVRNGHKINMSEIDAQNQTVVISLLTKCEWPTDSNILEGVWYVIQHADTGLMAYYYDKLKQSEAEGLLPSSLMAKMEDRMLMNHGFPQIYGTQVVQKSVYKMIDPANVNQRRSNVGLGTIEENTLKFGFEFKLEDYLDE